MNRRTAVAGIALAAASVLPAANVASAQQDLDCVDFAFQEDAQAEFNRDRSDPHRLDEDQGPDDGIACEALPRRMGATPRPLVPTAVPTRTMAPQPTAPTAPPSFGVRGGLGGSAGPHWLEVYAGLGLALCAAVGVAYRLVRRRS
ncbi:excalibur calcium-binding protein [Streptomyces sp. NPDC012637]|uniref:excalibur calcium-binding protein n=1 Tax=Streptomyces sp. NPDC012637 TaxID=3364842 RepID=UPI0036E1D48D